MDEKTIEAICTILAKGDSVEIRPGPNKTVKILYVKRKYVRTQFGLNYVENFMGYQTLFLLPAKYMAQNKVIALPIENIDLYYVDPSDSEFGQLGLNYTVQGETNLIGVHVKGDYNRATGDMYAIMGMKLWAEYLDGIAVITVSAGRISTHSLIST